MKAVIITIGDEILLGQILDTNSRYIAQELAQLGVETREMYSVADEPAEIRRALDAAVEQADFIFITGGLGPTKDDLTKKTLADYFGVELALNPLAQQWLEEKFSANPQRFNAANATQAYLPANVTPLYNQKGTAPGMWIEQGGKVWVSMPGVPFETEHLMQTQVLPRLRSLDGLADLCYEMVTVYDIAEAELSMRLEGFEVALQKGIGLAYLPSTGYIRLRLTAKGVAREQLPAALEGLLRALNGLRLSQGRELNVQQTLARLMTERGLTLATAESCTGGNIAHTLTEQPGASRYYLGGVVAYSNELKQKALGVRAEDLQQFGAVSEQVAKQMAEGARKLTGADYALSTTGVAGPDGGTPQKPVGTVWIALAGPMGVEAKKFTFSVTRERNIGRATVTALEWLVDELDK